MQHGDLRTFEVEKLKIIVSQDRKQLGELSARHLAAKINGLLREKEEIRMIFAAGPSQNELLYALADDRDIDWSRIVAFHMDEYIGLPQDSTELFGKFLNDRLFAKVKLKQVHLIAPLQSEKDALAECRRYEALLKERPIDIVCLGIGENGHIAFNDPPVADFNDPVFVKVVAMDERCKAQQVHDAGFSTIADVPPTAISLTIPALLSAEYLNIVVPGPRKAEAVRNALLGGITTKCPASVLRTHRAATLYLDSDSASLVQS